MALYDVHAGDGLLLYLVDASTADQAVAIARRQADESADSALHGVPQLRLQRLRHETIAEAFEGAYATLTADRQPLPNDNLGPTMSKTCIYYVYSRSHTKIGQIGARNPEDALAQVRRNPEAALDLPFPLHPSQRVAIADIFDGAYVAKKGTPTLREKVDSETAPESTTPTHTRRYLGSADITVGRLIDMLTAHVAQGGSPDALVFLETVSAKYCCVQQQKLALVRAEGAPTAIWLYGLRSEDT